MLGCCFYCYSSLLSHAVCSITNRWPKIILSHFMTATELHSDKSVNIDQVMDSSVGHPWPALRNIYQRNMSTKGHIRTEHCPFPIIFSFAGSGVDQQIDLSTGADICFAHEIELFNFPSTQHAMFIWPQKSSTFIPSVFFLCCSLLPASNNRITLRNARLVHHRPSSLTIIPCYDWYALYLGIISIVLAKTNRIRWMLASPHCCVVHFSRKKNKQNRIKPIESCSGKHWHGNLMSSALMCSAYTHIEHWALLSLECFGTRWRRRLLNGSGAARIALEAQNAKIRIPFNQFRNYTCVRRVFLRCCCCYFHFIAFHFKFSHRAQSPLILFAVWWMKTYIFVWFVVFNCVSLSNTHHITSHCWIERRFAASVPPSPFTVMLLCIAGT